MPNVSPKKKRICPNISFDCSGKIKNKKLIPTIINIGIKESYELVTYNPSKRIYEAVKKIPKGCVATYGQIAQMAGNKGMARAVGNALHKNPDPDNIPCYRVVNSKGELSGAFAFGGAKRQEELLKADGIEVINGKVSLKEYGMF